MLCAALTPACIFYSDEELTIFPESSLKKKSPDSSDSWKVELEDTTETVWLPPRGPGSAGQSLPFIKDCPFIMSLESDITRLSPWLSL